MIKNPILTGFNPDPCICRKGDDFYIAVSSFEWLPGIPIYHSKDLKHWELYTHVLTLNSQVELRKLPSAKGVWAPCLTYCEEEDSFYVIYGVMNSMNARYFDVDNYLIKAKDIRGPWTITDLSANHKGPDFPITNPKTGEVFYPPEGRYWVFNEREVKQRIADGRIIFGKGGNSRPVQKVFLSSRKQGKIRAESWWEDKGLNADATAEQKELFLATKLFVNPKPVKLIKNIRFIVK